MELTPIGPAVTAVVPCYNEERHIGSCLDGVLRQRGIGPIEVLVIDGMSTDRTAEIVRSYPQFGASLHLVENARRFQVYGWNIGIALARAPYVALFSAHAEYGDDYLAQCLSESERTGAGNVGGVPKAVHEAGALHAVIAWAMASPFGMGNAEFRYAKEERFVDSVFGVFCKTELIRALGGFDERIPFNEDAEMNYRIRQAGYKIFLSPKIEVRYHARSSWGALVQQLFRYGYWRRATQLKHPDYVPVRVLAPPAFVIALAASLGLLAAGYPVGWIVPAAYGVFCLFALASAARALRRPAALLTPLVLLAMHLAYGAGWLNGLIVHRRSSFAPRAGESLLESDDRAPGSELRGRSGAVGRDRPPFDNSAAV